MILIPNIPMQQMMREQDLTTSGTVILIHINTEGSTVQCMLHRTKNVPVLWNDYGEIVEVRIIHPPCQFQA
jgi:hypothetical protein